MTFSILMVTRQSDKWNASEKFHVAFENERTKHHERRKRCW
jgi:hypothetical protein